MAPLYPDAKTAVEMAHPAMKLTMVIETAPSFDFVPRLIPLLASMKLADILTVPWIAERTPVSDQAPSPVDRHPAPAQRMRRRDRLF